MTLAQRVIHIASNVSIEINEKVHQCFDRLNKSSSSHCSNDAKIMKAIEIMNEQIQWNIKNIMLYAGFKEHETKENNKSFILFLSSVIILETEKVFLDILRFRSSKQLKSSSMASTQVKPNVSHSSQEKSSTSTDRSTLLTTDPKKAKLMVTFELPSQKLTPTSTNRPTKLIANTKKHFIYLIPSVNTVSKILKSNNPTWKDVANLDNELKVSNHILHPAFRSSVERKIVKNKEALLLEWVPGTPISSVLELVSVKEFLTIGRKIVLSLLAMHMKRFIYHNLTSDHIIVDRESLSVKIIGCGSSTSFDSKKSYLTNHELLGNDSRFISPERTGHINRNVDYVSQQNNKYYYMY